MFHLGEILISVEETNKIEAEDPEKMLISVSGRVEHALYRINLILMLANFVKLLDTKESYTTQPHQKQPQKINPETNTQPTDLKTKTTNKHNQSN
jgi:hypothetical protein